MKSLFNFNYRYFLLTALLFGVETLIALYVHDTFVRPFFGDFLVTILLYCFIRTFMRVGVITTAAATLFIAYGIEALQAINFLHRVGWDRYTLLCVVLGTTFQWGDIVAYTLGIGLVILVEKTRDRGV